MIHNTPNTPLLDDSNNNHQKPLILKPCNQTQESKSSYFPYKTFINTDSSNDSVPNTSLIATPSVTVTNSVTASSKYGYESDSSEEGRNTSHQRLGLRVTNPDVRDDLSVEITPQTTTVTKLEPGEVEITNDIVSESSKIAIINDIKGEEQLSSSVQVTPHVLTALPVTRSSEDWKLYENRKPDISLPDQQQVKRLIRCDPPLQRRVSKTLAVPDEIVHNKDPKENNKHQTISYVQRQLDDCCSTSCHTTSDNCSTTETLPSVAPRTSTQLANEYARNNTSRYAKVSYHLTNDPTAIKLYREMAEKGNDTTTQLIFAKYLLETANAFYPPNAINPPPKIVGSLWGVGTTTKKSQRPEPYMVVPSPDDGASSIIEPSTASNHSVTVAPSLHSSTTPSALAAIAVKQQQASVTGVPESSVVNEPRRQKIKALEDEAVKWIRKLAKQNVGEACYMLANWMDKELYGFKINKVKSIHLHSIASKSNIPESVFIVAQHYEEEGKVPSARIIKLYRSAVENDYVNAVYKMSLLTIHGKLGLRQSLVDGLKLMHKACSLCSEEFNEPLLTFAQMLTNDYKDVDLPSALTEPYGGRQAAILYYERAARLNSDKAQSQLGSIYEHGRLGESMNFARAFDYYTAAAINGNSKAMLGLCRLYNHGSHGPGDHDEVHRLENDVSGWLNATPINEDLSFSWCERAANAGNTEALALLGWFYEIGFGVPRDFNQTKKYYQLAASQGHTSAKSKLLQIDSSTTKQQHDDIRSKGHNTKAETSVIDQPYTKKSKADRQSIHAKKSNCYCM